jgi:outer membrane protein TolC
MVRQRRAASRALLTWVVLAGGVVSAFGQTPSTGAQFWKLDAGAGVQTPAAPERPVRRLSLDDAVKLALEQNLSIQVERLNPAIQDLSIAQANTAWTPSAFATLDNNNLAAPPDSLFSGAEDQVTSETFQSNFGVQQRLPWAGGNYDVSWITSRRSTNNIFQSFEPTVRSFLEIRFTQPLLQNFGIDQPRQQLLITRKNREISDIQFRQTVVSTLRGVKNAYWDLVFAYSNLEVQQQSLELARQTLRDNRTRVEVGTMAPIDIVEAEAEVARNEEAVILAEAQIETAEDRLRSLVFDPAMPEFWNLRLELTDRPSQELAPVDIDTAVRSALDLRTDLRQARKSLEATDINLRYFRNQTLPQVNFNVTYNAEGLGGTELLREFGFPPGPVIGRLDRGLGSVLGDVLKSQYPDWTVGVSVSYPIGQSAADASLARTRLEYTQTQTQIRGIELQVGTQVRDLGRQVNTNLKRVEATQASRQLAERRLEAEQKKFSVGLSTSFQVFQAQRDLSAARNNELRAVLDYNKSKVDFEAVQETSLTGGAGGGLIVGGTTSGGFGGGATAGTAGFGTGAGVGVAGATGQQRQQ